MKEDLSRILGYLEALSKNDCIDADVKMDVELAAKAVIFAYSETVSEKFKVFLDTFDSDLTDNQRRHLHDMGLL